MMKRSFVGKPTWWRPATTEIQISPMREFVIRCSNHDIHGAISAMDILQTLHIRADPLVYSSLIKSCIEARDIHSGRRVHRHLFDSDGNIPATFLINQVLGMYVRFQRVEEARQVFDVMPEKNVVSWTTMISAYTNMKRGRMGLELFVMMGRSGVMPNMYTFSSVLRASDGLETVSMIHCPIVKVGLDSDVFVRSSLIDVYAKWGDLQSGFYVFDEMPTRDLVVWNSIISGYAQDGNGHVALDLYSKMRRAGFPANQGALTSVLRACTGLTLLEMGRQVHTHSIKFLTDLILNNALLDMYCKCGSSEDATCLFDRMVEKDIISWSTMISGLAQNGRNVEALELFDRMPLKPNYITMVGVLFACSHAGLVKKGWRHFNSISNPGREHYGCMVDLLGRAGKLDDAVKFIKEMNCEKDVVIWKSLLSSCRVHKDVELAGIVGRRILELNPDEEGAHILLSNTYADSQQWEKVREVRREMKARGVKKEPGCSWIEVGNRIETFIVGGSSTRTHQEMESVSKEVVRLIDRVTNEGGYIPDTSFVLHDVEVEQKKESLKYHSEKLAVAFGLMMLGKDKDIRVIKNLRICGDCHNFVKLVAMVERRKIVIRDAVRFHHFQHGVCSCGDYW